MDSVTGQSKAEHIEIDHPWISNDLMPLYRWTFPSEATDEALMACFQAREDWARRAHYPIAWVVDLSQITKAPATQRRRLAEHLERFEAFSARWNAGSALVVPNAWLRGLATAVFWVSPPKFPTEFFSKPVEAERWAKRRLAAKRAE